MVMNREIEFLNQITVNAHSSVRIETGGKVLYVDPFMLTEAPLDADVKSSFVSDSIDGLDALQL